MFGVCLECPWQVRLLIVAALKAKPGANYHFGLVCSSWVALCRFSSGRAFLAPHGNEELPWVEAGNRMVSRRALLRQNFHEVVCELSLACLCSVLMAHYLYPRFILIAYLLMSRGAHWTLEQPASSLMYRHRRFQEMCRRVKATCLQGRLPADNL